MTCEAQVQSSWKSFGAVDDNNAAGLKNFNDPNTVLKAERVMEDLLRSVRFGVRSIDSKVHCKLVKVVARLLIAPTWFAMAAASAGMCDRCFEKVLGESLERPVPEGGMKSYECQQVHAVHSDGVRQQDHGVHN